jgi:hypothetical protein
MERSGPPADRTSTGGQSLDSATVEMLTHTIFRILFRDGVRLPLHVDGLVDMDVVVKDNNIVIDVGRLEAELPPLSVWRVTVAYHGHPVLDYGRGVPNDAKVHLPRLCHLLLTSWVQRRKRYRARLGASLAGAPNTSGPREDRARPVGEPPG